LLTTRWLGRPLVILAECGSTNDEAAARARAGAENAKEGLVVVAEAQTAGRGRLGRSWHSPPGAGLAFTVLLRPDRPPSHIPPLTLLAGAAVAEALLRFGVQPTLKWPNDVQLRTAANGGVSQAANGGVSQAANGGVKKVAGILTEMATEGERVGHVVVGIGLNVNGTTFPAELVDRATSLELALGHPLPRAAVLAAVLAELEIAYDDFRAAGPAAAVARWTRHGALGVRCRVLSGGAPLEGVALGIDVDGALRLAGDDGRVHRVLSGEIAT
jgi:BirA family biotin operon repressor/biotin-[acetyl-CoA-carboxylase] ligase